MRSLPVNDDDDDDEDEEEEEEEEEAAAAVGEATTDADRGASLVKEELETGRGGLRGGIVGLITITTSDVAGSGIGSGESSAGDRGDPLPESISS